MKKLFRKAGKEIESAEKILVISHRKPDADTLGSAICLKLWLSKEGKDVTLACNDKPSKVFSFFPCIDEFVNDFKVEDYDLIIFVDVGASYMTNFHLKYENLFESEVPMINIDHHASNDNYGDINIVDINSSSATMILYKMLEFLGVEIDEKMATCLLAGIYGDTGSFMHTNTNMEVYKVASDLMKKGASIADVTKSLFNSNSVSTLRLWGKVLEKTFVTSENVVMSVIKDEDYDSANASPEDLSGVIDYLNMVPGSKFAVLINEDRKGNIKGSFRTQCDEVDLSRVAAVFGGGGHPKASGFMVKGKLEEEIRYKIVSDDMSKTSLEF